MTGISKISGVVVVDANIILSALRAGIAKKILQQATQFKFVTTDFTLVEVKSYLPKFARKAKVIPEIMEMALSLFPIERYGRVDYEDFVEEAERRIGQRDPKDVDLLALALKLNAPVWSNDKDFENTGVTHYPTAIFYGIAMDPK